MKKSTIITLAGLALVVGGLPYRCGVTEYSLRSDKIKKPVRFIILSDLHGTSYGKHMRKILKKVNQLNGDVILIPGDLFDEYTDDKNGFDLIKGLRKYPVYYCTGNHEEHRDDLESLKMKMKHFGIEVLNNQSEVIEVNGNKIEIGGIPSKKREYSYTPKDVDAVFQTDHYRLLLSHKPQWVNLYNLIHCDLIVSGHAHGGQWRIPFTKIGAAAPKQGLLPKYIDGVHELNEKQLVISRGLTKDYHGIPRLYNDPEIVVLNLYGKN